jgi:hypothetical protein
MIKPRFKYPSVTEVLQPYVDFSMVRADVLKAAQLRGTTVHAIIARYLQFGLALNIDERYQGYLDSFKRWHSQEVEEVLAVEERIFNDVYRVCGQLDLVVRLRRHPENLPIVVDIKTPIMSQKTWAAQVAAYKFLYEQDRVVITGTPASLQVDADGRKAKFRPVDSHKEAIRYWMEALDCFHYFFS